MCEKASLLIPANSKFHEEVDMNHVVFLDAKADELSRILIGKKTMLVRDAAGRKLPYGRVNSGDLLFF